MKHGILQTFSWRVLFTEHESDNSRHTTNSTNIISTLFDIVEALPLYAQIQFLHFDNKPVIWSLMKVINCIGRSYRYGNVYNQNKTRRQNITKILLEVALCNITKLIANILYMLK